MKINVVGTSGSGKSTFAKALGQTLNYPYIEMDALFWGKNWSMPEDEVFFKKLEQALQMNDWVLDGNYTRTTSIKWKEVDMVIWIDYSFLRTLFQAIHRAISRAITGEELWPGTGNREHFRTLFTKESIVLWSIKSYGKNKRNYTQIMKDPTYKHIQFIRLRNPRQRSAFLKSMQEQET